MISTLNESGYRRLALACVGILVVIGFAGLRPALVARADSSLAVSSTADVADATPGDTTCDTPGGAPSFGACTLRAAIQTAVNLSGTTTITLPAGTITIASARANGTADDGATGDFHIESNVIVLGQGQGTTIVDGAKRDRVFEVNCYPPTGLGTFTATFRNMTIQNGDATADVATNPPDPPESGGGIDGCGSSLTLDHVTVSGSIAGGGGGGGVSYFQKGNIGGGALTITQSTLSGNSAPNGGGIAAVAALLMISRSAISGNTATLAGAGGLELFGAATVDASTVSGNSATAASGASGGGIVTSSQTPTTLTINNTTVSGNSVTGAGGRGGGIFNLDGTVHITSSTINANGATTGGDIFNAILAPPPGVAQFGAIQPRQPGSAGPIDLKNTIVSNALSGGECSGPQISSAGYNIDSAKTCGFAATGDQQSTDPLLGVLADNTGGLMTHLPKAGSPAIDRASPTCPPTLLGSASAATDERGISRPQGKACDVGAVEVLFVAPILPAAGLPVSGGSLAGILAALSVAGVILAVALMATRRRRTES